jgi:Notch-like protein
VVEDGSVTWTDPLAAPTGADIVIAQLTVPTGTDFTATMNLRGRRVGGPLVNEFTEDYVQRDWEELGVFFGKVQWAIPPHAYSCSCVDGFANGVCEYGYISEYTTECGVLLSSSSEELSGNCDIDVDECASGPYSSGPCWHNSTCHQGVSSWACDCEEIVNARTGEREAFDGEMCENPINVCSYLEDDCDPLYATCHHLGPGHHECVCVVGWYGDGATCNDVNECASDPCLNGATCTESSCDASSFPDGTECLSVDAGLPPIDSYSCACAAGFANGLCFDGWDGKAEEYTSAYQESCTVALGGHCDVDIEECVSSPCANGAGCTDSHSTTHTGEAISFDAFSCACRAGYANGVCGYDDFITEYTSECTMAEGAICDLEVNECASSPCANGATCTESNTENGISIHTYQCTCVAGFANGV